ncbi:hypothetical protein HZH68_006097 [Vespula germanica]|uniref:Cilia- and flagella-associated protein 61 N-terminal domain-containing protein n=1 Tax=Vespula germanica TaxID=30212 RepID=A0A834KAW9_VESGE|nr:hypothetical protein HZH68_006097 [Vespula germanica]
MAHSGETFTRNRKIHSMRYRNKVIAVVVKELEDENGKRRVNFAWAIDPCKYSVIGIGVPVRKLTSFPISRNTNSVREAVVGQDRLREEDNDDIIPIIDADSSYVKEFYGEYYISEMTRYPDGHRQLIVSEDDNGLATGVICVNSTIDVDLLNENFELTLFDGLRKPQETDQDLKILKQSPSEVFFTFPETLQDTLDNSKYEQKSNAIVEEKLEIETTSENDETSLKTEKFIDKGINAEDQTDDTEFEEIYKQKKPFRKKRVRIDSTIYEEKVIRFKEENSKNVNEIRSALRKTSMKEETSYQESKEEDLDQDDRSSVSDQFDINEFEDAIFEVPKIYPATSLNVVELEPSDMKQDILTSPTYQGEVNAFVVEIFAVREDIGNRGTREFLEAAFECFPDLDYCVLLLPSTYSYFSFLELFVRVPLRYNKDFPMSLYVAHKAILFREIKSHKGDLCDITEIKQFLINIPRSKKIIEDFNRSVNQTSNNVYSYIFTSGDTIIGLAIVCIEKDQQEIKKHYHVDDFIVRQYIFHEAYGCLLHFVLMPIFSINQKFFFNEIMRLCDLTVLYYRLYEEEGSSLHDIDPNNVIFEFLDRFQNHYCAALRLTQFDKKTVCDSKTDANLHLMISIGCRYLSLCGVNLKC